MLLNFSDNMRTGALIVVWLCNPQQFSWSTCILHVTLLIIKQSLSYWIHNFYLFLLFIMAVTYLFRTQAPTLTSHLLKCRFLVLLVFWMSWILQNLQDLTKLLVNCWSYYLMKSHCVSHCCFLPLKYSPFWLA